MASQEQGAGGTNGACCYANAMGVTALPPSLDSEKDFLTGEGLWVHWSCPKTNFLSELLSLCLSFPT